MWPMGKESGRNWLNFSSYARFQTYILAQNLASGRNIDLTHEYQRRSGDILAAHLLAYSG